MCVHSLHPHSKLQKTKTLLYYYVAVIDTFFVCSNEEDENKLAF